MSYYNNRLDRSRRPSQSSNYSNHYYTRAPYEQHMMQMQSQMHPHPHTHGQSGFLPKEMIIPRSEMRKYLPTHLSKHLPFSPNPDVSVSDSRVSRTDLEHPHQTPSQLQQLSTMTAPLPGCPYTVDAAGLVTAVSHTPHHVFDCIVSLARERDQLLREVKSLREDTKSMKDDWASRQEKLEQLVAIAGAKQVVLWKFIDRLQTEQRNHVCGKDKLGESTLDEVNGVEEAMGSELSEAGTSSSGLGSFESKGGLGPSAEAFIPGVESPARNGTPRIPFLASPIKSYARIVSGATSPSKKIVGTGAVKSPKNSASLGAVKSPKSFGGLGAVKSPETVSGRVAASAASPAKSDATMVPSQVPGSPSKKIEERMQDLSLLDYGDPIKARNPALDIERPVTESTPLNELIGTIPPRWYAVCPISLTSSAGCQVATCSLQHLCEDHNDEEMVRCPRQYCWMVHEYRTCPEESNGYCCAIAKENEGNPEVGGLHMKKRAHKSRCSEEEWKARALLSTLREAHSQGLY